MKAFTVSVASDLAPALAVVREAMEIGVDQFVAVVHESGPFVRDFLMQVRSNGGRVRALRLREHSASRKDFRRAGWAKLASLDQQVRKDSLNGAIAALELLRGTTLETVILDVGSVAGAATVDLEAEVAACLDDSGACSLDMVKRLKERRAAGVVPHLEALCRSVHELLSRVDQLDVALLTPPSPLAVCLAEDLPHVLNDGGGKRRRYWHETAFAHWLAKAGVVREEQWFECAGGSLAGVLLSDAAGAQGGLAPGLGGVDFKKVKSLLPASCMRCAHLENPHALQMRYAAERLKDTGIW